MTDAGLRKDLGQHFLTRPEVCAPAIDYLRPAGRTVLEIGPGGGVLTQELLAAGSRVVGWEIDPRWAFALGRRGTADPLRIVLGDALDIPFERLPTGTLVAGNLPYNISTRLVLDCLEAARRRPGRIERAAFLVQWEVAERMLAGPGDSAYGSFSVLVGALADVERLGRVRPGAFRPPPKVDSAFVGLRPRSDRVPPELYGSFARVVRAAFALRRKTLRNSLATVWGASRATAWIESAGWDPRVRAEALALSDFVALARRVGDD